MGRILIGGFDQSTSARLALQLRAGRHDVQICESIETCDSLIRKPGTIDLVVVDVTAGSDSVEKCFRNIACVDVERGGKAMLLCVSRVYHGPRFEIDLENGGARLVYVH